MTKDDDETKDDTVDPEGLRRHYNVIIAGTGLVESIVAAALARVGSTVLHVDGADYYGQLDAVWTLPYARATHETTTQPMEQQQQQTPQNARVVVGEDSVLLQPLHPLGASQSLQVHSLRTTNATTIITIGTVLETPYGTGTVQALHAVAAEEEEDHYYTLTLQLLLSSSQQEATGASSSSSSSSTTRVSVGISPAWVQQQQQSDDDDDDVPNNAASPMTTLVLDTQQLFQHHSIRTRAAATAAKLFQAARSVALDITPVAVYAAGSAVNGLVASGVSEYVDFKSVEGLLYYYNHQHPSTSSSSSTCLQPVPCSKNDVFASRLLSPMDKRRLMKFLQTALDFATAEALQQEEEEQQDDDDDDGATTTETGGDALLQTFNERHLNQGRSLSRPQNKAVANADLAELQALCAAEENATSSKKNHRPLFLDYLHQRLSSPSLAPLVHYALALAHDDTTTTAADGMHELCHHLRALGRFGGTAFLVPMYGSGELAQAFCRSAAVFGATYLLRRAATGIVLQTTAEDGGGVAVQGVQLTTPPEEEESALGEKQVASQKTIGCDHMIVSAGALIDENCTTTSSTEQKPMLERVFRSIHLVHGKPLGQQQQQRHIVIFPPGSFTGQTSVIHGFVLDEYSRVVPMLGAAHGCALVHFTMTATDPAVAEAVFGLALDVVMNNSSSNATSSTPCEELFSMTFSYAVSSADETPLSSKSTPAGLHIVERSRPGLTADAAFVQAERIFRRICPNEKFLEVSEKVEDAIREALGDTALDGEPDEEEQVLESAVGLLQPTTAPTTAVNPTTADESAEERDE